MRKFRALVILNLKAMLTSFQVGGKRKKAQAASGLGAILLLAVLSLYLSGIYSFLFASQLAPLGMLDLLIMMMPVLAVILGFVFTLFATQGVVFGGKDNDLMLALPIPPFILMLSRVLALYVENLVFSLFVMVPAGVAYLWYGGEGGAVFLIMLLLCTLFLALIPTFLSLVFGFLLAWITSKFTKHALFSSLIYLIAFLLLFVGLFRLNFLISDLALYAVGIQNAFISWGLPFILLEQAACQVNMLSFLALMVLCTAPFLLVVWLFAQRYQKLVTALGAKSARNDYQLGTVSASGCRKALFKKEASKFFGTPIYLFNSGMGLILILLAGGAALFMREQLQTLLMQIHFAFSGLSILPLLIVTICFLLSMVIITAPSISLEGKQLWILKEAPIPIFSIFMVKVGFQLLLTIPCLLVSTVCLALAFQLDFVSWLLLIALTVLFSLCTAQLGLFVNLCLPKLDAPNDTVVVKQSASVIVTMLAGFGLLLVGGILFSVLRSTLGDLLALIPPLILLLIGSVVLYLLLNTRGKQLFLEL